MKIFRCIFLLCLLLGATGSAWAGSGLFHHFPGATGSTWAQNALTRLRGATLVSTWTGSALTTARHTRKTSAWDTAATQPLFSYSYSKKNGWQQDSGPINIDLTHWLFFGIFFIVMFLSWVVKLLCGPSYNGRRTTSWEDKTPQTQLSFAPLANHNDAISLALCEHDREFNTQDFLDWVKDIFLQVQHAQTARDLTALRRVQTPELCARYEAQFNEDLQMGRLRVAEHVAVENAYLFLFRQEPDYEYVAVFLKARMTAYVLDEKSGKVLSGSCDGQISPAFLYIFKRPRGAYKPAQAGFCPHCGAPLDAQHPDQCAYCDFVIKTSKYNWELDDIVDVKPPYANYGPGGVRRNGGAIWD